MDTQKLKLAIIQRITSCEDQQLLQTVYQLLDQLDSKVSNPTEYNSSQELLSAILGEPMKPAPGQKPSASQDEIDDLQRSIDDVFGSA